VDAADDYEGRATVEASTVMHDREGRPERAFVACRTDDGRRAWGRSADPDLAQELGRLMRDARSAHGDVIDVVLDKLSGHRLLTGKIVDVQRRTEAGFARGRAMIEGMDDDAGSSLVIEFQNEHLIAIRDGQVVATVPDLIMVLEAETGEPITTEELRYGFRITAAAAPCDDKWRTEGGLALVGPRYFGYDFDYQPIEVLANRAHAAPAQCDGAER
jgi:DUF917 family protein